MANLSFDYAKLTAHPRFKALAKKVNGQGQALDCICRFWNTAQDYWGKGRRPIPLKVFDLDDEWAALLDTDFAERRDDGVAANGAGEFFEWYAELREGAHKGGVKSAQVRRQKYGSAVPFGAKNTEVTPKSPRSMGVSLRSKSTEATEGPPNPSTTTSISTSEREPRWDPADPFASIFVNLIHTLRYQDIFEPEHDRSIIQGHMDRHGLTYAEMEQITWELRNWVDGPNAAVIKSPRGTLSTFVRQHLAKKAKEPKKVETSRLVTEADFDY